MQGAQRQRAQLASARPILKGSRLQNILASVIILFLLLSRTYQSEKSVLWSAVFDAGNFSKLMRRMYI